MRYGGLEAHPSYTLIRFALLPISPYSDILPIVHIADHHASLAMTCSIQFCVAEYLLSWVNVLEEDGIIVSSPVLKLI